MTKRNVAMANMRAVTTNQNVVMAKEKVVMEHKAVMKSKEADGQLGKGTMVHAEATVGAVGFVAWLDFQKTGWARLAALRKTRVMAQGQLVRTWAAGCQV